MSEHYLTVFTPTYNRAFCLGKCYESLKRQTCKDFVWMIVDDGSTDNTYELVQGWLSAENDFEIEYIHKENGGLHTGYNAAIEHAASRLMVCVDSDDYLTDNAVERIIDCWEKRGGEKYAGIVGLDIHENGEIIGGQIDGYTEINLIDVRVGKLRIGRGDRKIVVRTDLYKSVAPMPVLAGEKNFNPHYMHLQISREYDFLVLNEPLCVVEYLPNGMSHNIYKQYYNSPNSFIMSRKLMMCFPQAPLRFVFRQCIHYVSSCKIAGVHNIVGDSPKPLLTVLAYPFGLLLKQYILMKNQ